jgi:hypothetical protein
VRYADCSDVAPKKLRENHAQWRTKKLDMRSLAEDLVVQSLIVQDPIDNYGPIEQIRPS